jgi:hypothetical protein
MIFEIGANKMKVKELIAELKKMPKDLEVYFYWESCMRGYADLVFLVDNAEDKEETVLILEEEEASNARRQYNVLTKDKIQQGLLDSAAGRVRSLGSFQEHLTEEEPSK